VTKSGTTLDNRHGGTVTSGAVVVLLQQAAVVAVELFTVSRECSEQQDCYEDHPGDCWADSPLLKAAGCRGRSTVSASSQTSPPPNTLAYLKGK
jgi:hypothetical protein